MAVAVSWPDYQNLHDELPLDHAKLAYMDTGELCPHLPMVWGMV